MATQDNPSGAYASGERHSFSLWQHSEQLLPHLLCAGKRPTQTVRHLLFMSFIPWGSRKNATCGKKWQPRHEWFWFSRYPSTVCLEIRWDPLECIKPLISGNLRYDYGGGSGRLPAVPNIFGTGDQFPKAVFTETGLEMGMGQAVMLLQWEVTGEVSLAHLPLTSCCIPLPHRTGTCTSLQPGS